MDTIPFSRVEFYNQLIIEVTKKVYLIRTQSNVLIPNS